VLVLRGAACDVASGIHRGVCANVCVCVTPAYLLFERGRMWWSVALSVVVFFVGMVVAAVLSVYCLLSATFLS